MTLERRFLAIGCWQDCIGPGLPAGIETEERLPRRFAENTADIFALIKHQLPDEQLSQPALLIWPGDTTAEVKAFWRRACNHKGLNQTVDPERCQALQELADAFSAYPQYERCVRFYRQLATATWPRVDAHPLDFIRLGSTPRQGLPVALPPREPRAQPHRLHVRFHRGRGGR